MGTISSRDLSPSMRKRLASRAPAVEPDVCSVGAFLPCRVPTVGLHDKGAMIYAKGGASRYSSHADSKALRAAKELYAKLLPAVARPVAPPLALSVQFVLTPPPSMKRFEGVLPYTGKPDLSNLMKVFEDALRRAGYMSDDCKVVRYDPPPGKWVSHDPRVQGVSFQIRTLIESYQVLPFEHPKGLEDRPGRLIRWSYLVAPAKHV